MGLASLGWGAWWLEFAALRFFPDHAPSLAVAGTLAGAFAVVGTVAALLALRGRNVAWLAVASVPLLANLSLLAVPFLLPADLGAR